MVTVSVYHIRVFSLDKDYKPFYIDRGVVDDPHFQFTLDLHT